MKLGPVTKLDKRNMQPRKKLVITSCRQLVTSLLFFRYMTNLEQSRRRIPDAWSVKLTFALIVTCYLTKSQNRTKNKKISNTALILLH